MQRIRILLDSTSQRIATNLDALVARSAVTLDKTGNRIHMTIERFLDVSYLVLRHIDYAADRLLTELWLSASGTMIDYDGSRLSLSALSDLLLTHKDYDVSGCTALLDAVGSTVKKVENIQERLPEEMKAEKIIFVITTDGQENSSQEYTAGMVKKMIERNQEKGWQFLFLGANMDAVEEAEKIGIRRTHAASYKNDARGVQLNYEAAGRVMSCMRAPGCKMEEMDLLVSEFLRPVTQHLEESDSRH